MQKKRQWRSDFCEAKKFVYKPGILQSAFAKFATHAKELGVNHKDMACMFFHNVRMSGTCFCIFQHRRMHWLCGRLQGSECICLSFGFLSIKQTLSCQKLVAGRFWKTLMTRKGRNEGSGSRSLSWRNCEVILSQAHVVNTSGSVLWKYIHPSPACQE